MTTVVNFRDVKEHWNADTQQWDDPKYVYIGRANATYNLPQSPWANPYKMKSESDRQRVIEQYREWVNHRSGYGGLEALRGKTLVCWCKPKHCHGDVLLELVEDRKLL